MSGFSPDWLALREAADHRSRNRELASALAARLQQREHVSVVDLGCGTGSNLRATSELLPDRQSWTLVDHDPALLAAAKDTLARWADGVEDTGEVLTITKSHKVVTVRFRQADLAADLDAALGSPADLVTASALFDLVSAEYIRRFVGAIVSRRAAFYTVLTYNGIQRWTPHRPADNAMTAAFHRHQMTDKGFGTAAGPMAPSHLADEFRNAGYAVQEGDSPWRLTAPRDAGLIKELADGFAGAVRETGKVDAKTIDAWMKVVRTGAETGHTDTLALPGM